MDAVKYFILFLNVYIQIVYVEMFAAIYDTKWVLDMFTVPMHKHYYEL